MEFYFFQILDPYDETRCQMRPNGTKPNRDHTNCTKIPEDYLRLNSYWAIGSMTFALVGIILAFGILVVFIR